jgi:hypothetical protein
VLHRTSAAMAYSLKPGRTVSNNVAHIVEKHARRAAAELHGGELRHWTAVHRARRHLKKAIAALMLLDHDASVRFVPVRRRLRAASRLLAVIADAGALIECLDRIARQRAMGTHGAVMRQVRSALLDRARRAERRATFAGAHRKLTRLLDAAALNLPIERRAHGFGAVRPALERSYRRAVSGADRVRRAPTARATHRWRRRVKTLWYQTRLLDRRCGYKLTSQSARLEVLDGLLGEWRNVALLERALLRTGCLRRADTARLLRQFRRRKARLRQRAIVLAARTFTEEPSAFADRLAGFWADAQRTARRGASRWQPA